MGTRFSFDENAFRNAVREQISGAMSSIGESVQRIFDSVYASHRGQPLQSVARALRAAAASADLNFTDEQIGHYAEAISEGRRIRVEADPTLET
jgi:hypothetical protein